MTLSNYKTNFRTYWTKNSKNNPHSQILSLSLQSLFMNHYFSIRTFFLIHMFQKQKLGNFHSKLVRNVSLIIITIVFQNCASSGFGTQGLLYENQKISIMETGFPSTKEGFSCAKSYLGLIAWGDASIEESQKQGNIKEITSIELETYNFLGIYAKLCTVTKGI